MEVKMKRIALIILITIGFISLMYTEELTLQKELEPLRQYIGSTWKGTMQGADPEKPSYDIQHWDRILNGTAIKITHSINNGEYGGETIIFWDKEQETLAYYYFTTAGFYTSGTMIIENGDYIAVEKVKGNDQGITEVKSTSQKMPDGSMKISSEYLKEGEWIAGHEIIYFDAPDEKVLFK